MSQAAPIAASVVDEAIAWSVKLNFSTPDPATRAAFERWRTAAADHERVWLRMQALDAEFSSVPKGLALDTLTAIGAVHRTRGQQRRLVLKSLLLAGGVLGGGWIAREQTPWQRILADVSTPIGTRQQMTLPDGTRLTLNTDSAVGIDMTGAQRVLTLYRGEIAIQTGADAAFTVKRPLLVHTPFGVVEALGTRFVVRLHDDSAQISVQEDAVALRPASGAHTAIIEAGQTGRLDRQHAQRATDTAMVADAWVEGVISGTNMRLDDVLAELARHRHGRIRCAPEIADLPVSGTYHLQDIDQTLRFLAQSLPIRLQYWTRYWITVAPA